MKCSKGRKGIQGKETSQAKARSLSEYVILEQIWKVRFTQNLMGMARDETMEVGSKEITWHCSMCEGFAFYPIINCN